MKFILVLPPVHTCPAEFSIPTALRWPIDVHYSFSLSSMDHDFFYPHRPRRTPLQLATYAPVGIIDSLSLSFTTITDLT